MFLSHLYIYFIAIAFGCSLFSFKLNYPKHLTLLSILFGLALLVEFIAVDVLKEFGIKNNMIVYNPFMIIEFCAYALFFKMITKFNWLKRIINGYLIMFPIFSFFCIFVLFGINNWNSYVSVLGSAFTIFLAVMYYYQLLFSAELYKLGHTPEFWIATGLIIFYAGNLPYTGMLNFLNYNYKDLATQLSYVLKVLNIVMYSLFTYAYLCQPKTNLVNSI